MNFTKPKFLTALVAALAATVVAGAEPFQPADSSEFVKPFKGVKAVAGKRPLLVVLLAPGTFLMPSRREVYALGADGYVGLTVFDVNDETGQRSGWGAGPGYTAMPRTQKFKSAPAVLDSPNGRLRSVFALGDDGTMYQTYFGVIRADAAGRAWQWAPWSALPKNVKLKSGPAVMNSSDGSLASVFAVGQDGAIYQAVYKRGPTGGWSSWNRIPGNIKFVSAPAVMNSPDGSVVDLFATGEDGYVHEIVYFRGPGSHWGEWSTLPGNVKFKSGPSVMNSPDGSLASVFALGTDGYAYQITYSRGPGSHWNTWQKLPGTVKFTHGLSTLNSPSGGLAEVFATGTDGHVYQLIYTRGPGSHWGAWTLVEPTSTATSAPAAAVALETVRSAKAYQEQFFGSQDSVRAYYLETSYGKFTFDEAYTTPWLAARDDPSTPDVDESTWDFLHKSDIEKKGAWVLQQVEKQTSFRFSKYDKDSDGVVTSDELSVIWVYPGASSGVRRATNPARVKVPSLAHGVQLGGLIRGGSVGGANLFAHELGHLPLGLDDLYEDSSHTGVKSYSLMGTYPGSVGLSHLDPWSKGKLGWVLPQVVENDGWFNVAASESQPVSYVLHDKSRGPKEYFLVENRWPPSSSESGLPDQGLAVWHIREDPKNDPWGRETIRLVWAGGEGIEAQALFDGSDPATGYDLSDTSTPANLRWADGSPSGIKIRNIPQAAKQMKVYFEVP